jgi:hypothetical protein
MGRDPLDARELAFVYEGRAIVLNDGRCLLGAAL